MRLAAVAAALFVLASSAAPVEGLDGASPTPSLVPEPEGDRLTWGIQPSTPDGPTSRAQFDYALGPGDEVVDYVGISNFSERPIELALYATDAFNTATGAFALLERADVPSDVGSWVQLQETSLTIPARRRMDVPFLLRVPDNATPGDHIGGIVAGLQAVATGASGQSVTVERRIGTRIYLRVDGQLDPSLVLEQLEATYEGSWNPIDGTLHLEYLVRNDGNVRISGRQELTVDGPVGWALKELQLQPLPEILPGQSIPVTFDLPQVLPAVLLTTGLRIEPMRLDDPADAAAEVTSRVATTLAMPWTAIGVLVVFAEAAFAARWAVIQSRRRADARIAAAVAAARIAAGATVSERTPNDA